MTYRLDSISVRLTDDKEGFEKINEIYDDISKGKIPLIHNNKRKLDDDVILLAEYDSYDENGYKFTAFADDCDTLLQIHKWINYGDIALFEGEGSNINQARINAREKLMRDTNIKRIFKNDFESIVTRKRSRDGKVYCNLYVGIENKYGHY